MHCKLVFVNAAIVARDKLLLMNMDRSTNSVLWSQFKGGSREAFAEIYSSQIDALIGYGTKFCSDSELLKDTIQDLFVELWKSRQNLVQPKCLSFYLFKALRYKLTRALKLSRPHESLSASIFPDSDAGMSSTTNSIETEVIDKEMLDAQINSLRNAISTLTKRQQEAIQLRFYQGFTNEQIAELMEMNYQSVCNLLYSALNRIKKNLKSAPAFTAVFWAAFQLFV